MSAGAKVFVLLRASCCAISYYNFNLSGIFENMTSFTPIFNQELEQGKLMAALNLANKGPKNVRCNVRNRLKSGKISKKDLSCTKNGYREFDHIGTLRAKQLLVLKRSVFSWF